MTQIERIFTDLIREHQLNLPATKAGLCDPCSIKLINFMKSYFYICSNCNSEFDISEIEPNFIYLCPKCGKAEPNKPLEGVLEIVYDYESLKKKLSKENFLKLPSRKILAVS